MKTNNKTIKRLANSLSSLSHSNIRLWRTHHSNHFLISDSFFTRCEFNPINFSLTTFRNCEFNHCEFNHCEFNDVTFDICEFNNCKFNNIIVRNTANLETSSFSFQGHPIPRILNLKHKVAETITSPCMTLNMQHWHSCGTTHCLAGWAIHLAGDDGYELERHTCPALAGALIWLYSEGEFPDFYSGPDKAHRWLCEQ